MNWTFILIPLISAFIGWLTNWVAIKMLFHPVKPVNILGMTVQGIFPKRQRQFAEKLGRLVSNELLSFGDIEEKITHPDNIKKILPHIEKHIDEFLRERIKVVFPVISMFIGDKTITQLKAAFMEELDRMLPMVMQNYMGNLKHELDLERIVVSKVAAFSTDKLESILYAIMSKEFRFVEIIGGVLGLLIGLLQVLLTMLLG